MTISDKANELLSFLREEYIKEGYMYSGSWPYVSLREKGFQREAFSELENNGLIQKRNCSDLAYELTPQERHRLLSKHSLCSRWFEIAGNAFLDDIRAEACDVSFVKQSVHNIDLFTVDTLKNVDDNSKPDKMDVTCPFTVGQVIQVEYDLPKQKAYVGYSSLNYFPGGVAVGDFMVTDVVCNMLVDPPVNMIELQSLSAEFNQVHSDSRTMLLFEDIVLKRLKENNSLDNKIQAADQDKTGKSITVESPARDVR